MSYEEIDNSCILHHSEKMQALFLSRKNKINLDLIWNGQLIIVDNDNWIFHSMCWATRAHKTYTVGNADFDSNKF